MCGWRRGGSKGFEFARGGEGVGGGVKGLSSRAEVSSLMKQKIKGEKCAVFCFAGKRKIFIIYL
jgi:hypothetical protein